MAASRLNSTTAIMHRVMDVPAESKRRLPPIQGYEHERLTSLEKAVQPILPLVLNLQRMVSEVKQRCQQPADNLTVDESAAIMLYTVEDIPFYTTLNETLRTEDRQRLKPWFLYLRLFCTALAKLPPANVRIVYRGVNRDFSAEYTKNSTVVWWAFSSCTTSLEVVEKFLNPNGTSTVFNIECDHAKNIARHSWFPREDEVLLFPARQFTVVSLMRTSSRNQTIHLKETHPRPPLIEIPKVSSTASSGASAQQNEELLKALDELAHRSKLDLSARNLADGHMDVVAREAIVGKQCTRLNLEKNKIAAPGMDRIADALKNNTTLDSLDVSYNPLGDDGISLLAEVLAMDNSKLKALHLWSIGLTDAGVEHLARMLRTNRRLTHLSLSENRISRAGVEQLASVLTNRNSTLTTLDLSHHKSIDDACVDSFVRLLQGSHSLTELNLEKCSLSAKGKDKLQEACRSRKGFNLMF